MSNPTKLSERLETAMKRRGMTARAIVVKLRDQGYPLSDAAIYFILDGTTKQPTAQTLWMLAKGLDVPIEELDPQYRGWQKRTAVMPYLLDALAKGRWTITDLAEASNISDQTISRIAHGGYTRLPEGEARLAQILKVPDWARQVHARTELRRRAPSEEPAVPEQTADAGSAVPAAPAPPPETLHQAALEEAAAGEARAIDAAAAAAAGGTQGIAQGVPAPEPPAALPPAPEPADKGSTVEWLLVSVLTEMARTDAPTRLSQWLTRVAALAVYEPQYLQHPAAATLLQLIENAVDPATPRAVPGPAEILALMDAAARTSRPTAGVGHERTILRDLMGALREALGLGSDAPAAEEGDPAWTR